MFSEGYLEIKKNETIYLKKSYTIDNCYRFGNFGCYW